MLKQMGLVSVVGFMGLVAAAAAQAAPTSTSGEPFEGTYRLASSAKVNDTYMSYNGQTGMCPSPKPGPLHVAGGGVHYTTATGYRLSRVVGP